MSLFVYQKWDNLSCYDLIPLSRSLDDDQLPSTSCGIGTVLKWLQKVLADFCSMASMLNWSVGRCIKQNDKDG